MKIRCVDAKGEERWISGSLDTIFLASTLLLGHLFATPTAVLSLFILVPGGALLATTISSWRFMWRYRRPDHNARVAFSELRQQLSRSGLRVGLCTLRVDPSDLTMNARVVLRLTGPTVLASQGLVNALMKANTRATTILTHELAHVHGRDYLFLFFALLATINLPTAPFGFFVAMSQAAAAGLPATVLFLPTISPLIAFLLAYALLHRREFLADARAINVLESFEVYTSLLRSQQFARSRFHPKSGTRLHAMAFGSPVLRRSNGLLLLGGFALAIAALSAAANFLFPDELSPARILVALPAMLVLLGWFILEYAKGGCEKRPLLRNEEPPFDLLVCCRECWLIQADGNSRCRDCGGDLSEENLEFAHDASELIDAVRLRGGGPPPTADESAAAEAISRPDFDPSEGEYRA